MFWGFVARWRALCCRRVASRGLAGVLLASVAVLVGGAFVGGSAGLGAQAYSAFEDPRKPVVSVLLSEKENVQAFRQEFGLDEGETEKALSIVRAENERLAEEHAESEKIAANRSLPDEEISDKIAASDYDETVSSAVEETKDDIAALLPEAERDGLAAWVDERWRAEVAEASEGGSGRMVEGKGGRRSLLCDKIFATQYKGYTRFEAALPHRELKFGSRPEVPIIRGKRSIRPRIKEVGPWNTYDNYWRSGKNRDMWKNLRQCVPEARAAYYNNYNKGEDEFGREVLNPAGVDLTPAAARKLGLDKYQNAWVAVRFPWIPR